MACIYTLLALAVVVVAGLIIVLWREPSMDQLDIVALPHAGWCSKVVRRGGRLERCHRPATHGVVTERVVGGKTTLDPRCSQCLPQPETSDRARPVSRDSVK